MRCKHEDGWIIDSEDMVINFYDRNEDIECYVRCNHIGCKAKKKVSFNISDIVEIEEE